LTSTVDWLLADEASGGELIQTQATQPGPRQQPAPRANNMPALSGERRTVAPRQQATPVPVQPEPQPNVALPSNTAATSNPTSVWSELMKRHGVPPEQWGGLTDRYYDIDRNKGQANTGNPQLDADLQEYARRFPGQGRSDAERARPAPAPQPAQPQPQAQPKGSTLDWMLDDDKPAAQPAPPPAAPAPVANSKHGTHRGDKIGTYIKGNVDPNYANVPGFREEDLQTSAATLQPDYDGGRRMAFGKVFAGDDAAYHNIIRSELGPAYVRTEKDAHGQQVLVFKDAAGQEQKRYANKPGLDGQDVDRALFGTLPYMVTGGIAGALTRAKPLANQMLAHLGAAAGTRYVSDAGSNLMLGADQPADFGAAAIQGIAGATGPVIGRVLGNTVRATKTVPSIVDDAGNLTARGQALAEKAGLDAAAIQGDMAKEFAKTYAKTASEAEAAAIASTKPYGIKVSRGQVTNDPEQLLMEKEMRHGVHGTKSKEVMQGLKDEQDQQIFGAALGYPNKRGQGQTPAIAEMIAPHRGVAETNVNVLGPTIRGGVQEAQETASNFAGKAWKEVGDTYASKTALGDLPSAVQGRLKATGMDVDDALMPASKRMGESIRDYMGSKITAGAVPEVFGSRASLSVDEMRRRLLAQYGSAAPGSPDAKAAKAIYDGFDDWLLSSADKMISTGAKDAAQNAVALRTARDATKELKQIFEPSFRGKATPAGNIIDKVINEEKGASAEGVVNTLFGAFAKTGAPKDGTEEALKHIKTGLLNPKWGVQGGKETWDDIRLAYWSRIVIDKQGQMHPPGVMLNNIENVLHSQRSIINVLYAPEEARAMRQFANALRVVARKDANPSGSGVAIARSSKEFATTMLKAIGWQTNGPVGLALATAMEPLRNVIGSVGAKSSVAQRAPRILDPNMAHLPNAMMQAGLRTDFGGPPRPDE